MGFKFKSKVKAAGPEEKRLGLGKFLAKLRAGEGLSLKGAEAATGIPGANIYRFEQGTSRLSFDDAVKIADYYSVDINDLAEMVR